MSITEAIISIFTPYDCLSCGQEGKIVCGGCSSSEILPVASRCYDCKALTADYAVCDKCRPRTRLRHVWVATEYDGLAQRLIHALKFERSKSAVVVLAQILADTLPQLDASTVIVPIPTATSRVRQRGYDQSVLVARHLAKLTGLRYQELLSRHGQSRQVRANRNQRLNQLDGAFSVTRPGVATGSQVLLVDDITTTGATIGTVAAVLKKAGAKQVDACVFAQKV